MDKDELKALIGFQQGELDAVILYQALAKRMKDEETKQILLSIAADEGKHAAILRQYTETKLEPKPTLKNVSLLAHRIVGKKTLFKIMAKFEYNAANNYAPYFEKYPRIRDEITPDETKHGNLLMSLI